MPIRAVIAAVLLLATAACGRPASPNDATPVPLAGTEWQLRAYILDGRTVTVTADVDAVLRFDGDGGYFSKACNQQDGTADIDGDVLRLASTHSTEMGCDGPAGDADLALGSLQDRAVGWIVEGDRLTLTSGTTTLRYQVRDGIYPTRDAHAVLAGERGGRQFRLAVTAAGTTSRGLVLETRDAPEDPWGINAAGGPDGVEPPLYTIVVGDVGGGRPLVAGFVPARAVRVTHQESADAAPVELRLYDVNDPEYVIAAGLVEGHSGESRIRAYDEAGTVVASWG